jgi:hypothetical protein
MINNAERLATVQIVLLALRTPKACFPAQD